MSVENPSVHRYFLTGAYAYPITHLQGFQWHILFRAVGAQSSSGFGRKSQQCTDGGARAAPGGELEPFTQQDQADDDRRGFEIDTYQAVLVPHLRWKGG